MAADSNDRGPIKVLPAETVEHYLEIICQMAQDDPKRLSRLLRCADRFLANHLVEEDLFYLHDLGLIEVDGRLLPDFRDVLVALVDDGPDGPVICMP